MFYPHVTSPLTEYRINHIPKKVVVFTVTHLLTIIKHLHMEPKDKVFETIKKTGKPMKAGEVAEAAGIDKKEVDKSIKKLVAEGVLHSPVRCFYDLKK